MHNLYNSMAAVLVGQQLGVDAGSMRSTLKTFEGVEHRLEFVRRLNNVSYYNDSKATNVDSVWYALQSFKEPIVLFLGGRDKGNDYSRLIELVRRQVKAIVAIGESANHSRTVIQRCDSDHKSIFDGRGSCYSTLSCSTRRRGSSFSSLCILRLV